MGKTPFATNTIYHFLPGSRDQFLGITLEDLGSTQKKKIKKKKWDSIIDWNTQNLTQRAFVLSAFTIHFFKIVKLTAEFIHSFPKTHLNSTITLY